MKNSPEGFTDQRVEGQTTFALTLVESNEQYVAIFSGEALEEDFSTPRLQGSIYQDVMFSLARDPLGKHLNPRKDFIPLESMGLQNPNRFQRGCGRFKGPALLAVPERESSREPAEAATHRRATPQASPPRHWATKA